MAEYAIRVLADDTQVDVRLCNRPGSTCKRCPQWLFRAEGLTCAYRRIVRPPTRPVNDAADVRAQWERLDLQREPVRREAARLAALYDESPKEAPPDA